MIRRGLIAGLVIAAGVGGPGSAAEPVAAPQIFSRASWICRSPEDYALALAEAKKADDVEELGEELLERQLCLYLEYDDIEDIFAPFVQVLDRRDDLVKVAFTIEFYRRVGTLGGRFSSVKFIGWTDPANLEDY